MKSSNGCDAPNHGAVSWRGIIVGAAAGVAAAAAVAVLAARRWAPKPTTHHHEKTHFAPPVVVEGEGRYRRDGRGDTEFRAAAKNALKLQKRRGSDPLSCSSGSGSGDCAPSHNAGIVGAMRTGEEEEEEEDAPDLVVTDPNEFSVIPHTLTQAGDHHVGPADLLSRRDGRSPARKLSVSSDRELPRYPIWRIAITGGPCSGKSTCMERVRTAMRSEGYAVFVVPEVATILINGGLDVAVKSTPERTIAVQKVILQTILRMEDSFYELARNSGRPAIVLCDRGTMDGRAYCSEEEWRCILNDCSLSVEELRDARYDAVVHLVTAAIGAPQFYTLANNEARRETAEEAANLDLATRSKWLGHRAIAVIDNSTNFAHKVTRVTDFVRALVTPHSVQPPFRTLPVSKCPLSAWPVDTSEVQTAVHPLAPRPGFLSEEAIRRSTANAEIFYLRAVRGDVGTPKTERSGEADAFEGYGNRTYVRISARAFRSFLDERTSGAQPVQCKHHTSFFFGNRYFRLTKWLAPESKRGLMLLHVPQDCRREEFPPFIEMKE